jgi:hypothetical protein
MSELMKFVTPGSRTAAAVQAGAGAGPAEELQLPGMIIPLDHCDRRAEQIRNEMGQWAKEGIVGYYGDFEKSGYYKTAQKAIDSFMRQRAALSMLSSGWDAAVAPAARAAAAVGKFRAVALKSGVMPENVKGMRDDFGDANVDHALNVDSMVTKREKNAILQQGKSIILGKQMSVTNAAKRVEDARKALSAAQLGFQSLMLGGVINELRRRQKEDKDKQEEIQRKIEGVTRVCDGISEIADLAVTGGAAGKIPGVAGKLGIGGEEHATWRAEQQFDLIKERVEGGGQAASLAGKVAKEVLSVQYQGQLNELTTRIGLAQSQLQGLADIQAAIDAQAQVAKLHAAISHFQSELSIYDDAVADREVAYMQIAQKADEQLNGGPLKDGAQNDFASEAMMVFSSASEAQSAVNVATPGVDAAAGLQEAAEKELSYRGNEYSNAKGRWRLDVDNAPDAAAAEAMGGVLKRWKAAAEKAKDEATNLAKGGGDFGLGTY